MKILVNANLFQKAIKQVEKGRSEYHDVLSSLRFTVKETSLTILSCDGISTMSRTILIRNPKNITEQFIVPGGVVEWAKDKIKKGAIFVTIKTDRETGVIEFITEGSKVNFDLDGLYPLVDAVTDSLSPVVVITANLGTFRKAVVEANEFSMKFYDVKAVKFQQEDDGIKLLAINREGGTPKKWAIKSEITWEHGKTKNKINTFVDPMYLVRLLEEMKGDQVEVAFGLSDHPLTFESKGNSFNGLIMPMHGKFF